MATTAPEVPPNPFRNIVLSLSGGGYRASGFHLGVMDLLDELNLLKKVTVLSTVSGGTITGALYAVSDAAGKDYESFFKRVYEFLRHINVVQMALDGMRREEAGCLSLIMGAAQVYADRLLADFDNPTFGQLLDASRKTHLEELAFNATEFRHGLSFRFVKSQSPGAVFGNKFFPVNESVAKRIRVADVVAASSCFPGAFEPLNFPEHFRWATPGGLDSARGELGNAFKVEKDGEIINVSLPLMDGGVYDNQGLESVSLTAGRAGADIGLIIVADTSQRNDAILESSGRLRQGGLTLLTLAWVLRLISALSCVTVAAVAAKFYETASGTGLTLFGFARSHPYEAAFVYAMPLALAAAIAGLLLWLHRLIRRNRCVEVYGTTFDVWKIARGLSARDLFGLLRARADSLVAMSSTIFLNRVRSQGFRRYAEDPKFQKRTVFNLIYRMTTRHPALFSKEEAMKPSPKLADLAMRTEKVETKLWVRDEAELKDLIACGQATTCFNLLRHLLQVYGPQIEARDPAIFPVFDQLMKVWAGLKKDPQALLSRERSHQHERDAPPLPGAPPSPADARKRLAPDPGASAAQSSEEKTI